MTRAQLDHTAPATGLDSRPCGRESFAELAQHLAARDDGALGRRARLFLDLALEQMPPAALAVLEVVAAGPVGTWENRASALRQLARECPQAGWYLRVEKVKAQPRWRLSWATTPGQERRARPAGSDLPGPVLELFQEAREHLLQRTLAGYRGAIARLLRVVALGSERGVLGCPAAVGLLWMVRLVAAAHTEEPLDEAQMEHDLAPYHGRSGPGLGLVYAAQAILASCRRDFAAAEALYAEALRQPRCKIEPLVAVAIRHWRAELFAVQGLTEQADEEIATAVRSCPFVPPLIRCREILFELLARRLGKARERLTAALQAGPIGTTWALAARVCLAEARAKEPGSAARASLLQEGRVAASRAVDGDQDLAHRPTSAALCERCHFSAVAAALLGDTDAAQEFRQQAEADFTEIGTRTAVGERVPAFDLTLAYLGMGRRDLALTTLRRAAEDTQLLHPKLAYAGTDERLDELRDDPAFQGICRVLFANARPDAPVLAGRA